MINLDTKRVMFGMLAPVMIVCAGMGQTKDAGRNATSTDCASFKRSTTAGSLGIFLPEPITLRDLQRYQHILEVSEEQFEAMRRLHQVYCEGCAEMKLRCVDELWRRAAAISRASASSKTNTKPAADWESLMKDRSEFLRNLTSSESTLFAELSTFLTEQQQSALPLVQADRSRQVCGVVAFASAIHGEARIDLVELVEELGIGKDNSEVRKTLTAYSQTLALRLCDVATSWVENSIKDAYFLEELEALVQPDERASIGAGIMERRKELFRRRILDDRKLKETNLVFLHQLEKVLPEPEKRRLQDEFFHRSYPKLYPDRLSPEPTIKMVLGLPNITDEQRTAIDAMAEQCRAEYTGLCREAEEHITKWAEIRLGGGEVHVDEIRDHEDTLKRMMAQRQALLTRVYKQMMDLLTPEQKAAIPPVRQRERIATPPTTAPAK